MSGNSPQEAKATTHIDNNGNEYKWACCQDATLPITDAIGCDGKDSHGNLCIYWTHFQCAGFDKDTINTLQNGTTEMTYYCKHCQQIQINMDKTINNNNSNQKTTNANIKASQDTVIEMRWVQCDKCLKWRRIPISISDTELEGEWTCANNKWDLKHNNCSIEEEPYDPIQEETININDNKKQLISNNKHNNNLAPTKPIINGDYNAQDVPMLEFITPKKNKNNMQHIIKKTKTTKDRKSKKPPGYKRLTKEIQSLLLNPPRGIGACPISINDLLHWFATIDGPENTPYFGYLFYLTIDFGENYPFEAPKVVFKTKIYHCNINTKNGAICLDILKDSYSPALTVEKILLSVSALLQTPNPEDPLVPKIAKLLIRDKELHDITAKEWTKRYAQEIIKK